MNRFSIRDVENLTGIKAHTLRIWEQRYGIVVPQRTDTNIRYYSSEDLKQILKIVLLNQQGYKISRIRKMSEEEANKLLSQASDAEFQYNILINDLLEATIDMDTYRFEMLLNTYIKNNGIEQTVEHLLFGFLEKVGVLWMSDHIMPAHEHLVSNIIVRKLHTAIEKLILQPQTGQTRYLLFLPQAENHETGLLYIQYFLLRQGRNVVYLGSDTPMDQVTHVSKELNIKHLYTHITAGAGDFDISRYLKKLAEQHPDCTIMVSGLVVQRRRLMDTPPNVVLLHSLAEAKAHLYKTL
ncbi:MAG TPA: MerR family transcriptional regulator [Flavipsychrobacter sp.]